MLMNRILPDELGRHYNQIADIYEQKRSLTIGTNYADKFLQLLLPHFDCPDSCTILDIGCGTGIP
jgi:hypothetical protein